MSEKQEKKPVEELEVQAEEQKDAGGQSCCGATTTSTCHYNVNSRLTRGICGYQTTSVCKVDVSY